MNKKNIFTFLLLLFFILPVISSKPFSKMRILTYNTAYCKGNFGKASFAQKNINDIADVIRALDADMIAVQELDSASKGRGKRFLLQEIASATGLDYQVFYGGTQEFDQGSIGCGILIKPEYKVLSHKVLSLPGDEKRACVVVELEDCVFLGTHLDLNDSLRIRSAQLIVDEIKQWKKPVFLAGDLNDSHRWNSAFKAVFSKDLLKLSTDSYSISNPDNHNTIDYVLGSPECHTVYQVTGSKALRYLKIDGVEKDLSIVSDHLPVYLDVEKKNRK